MKNRYRIHLAWLMWMAMTGTAQASDPDSALTLHGFGTLGLARTDDDSAEYVRDLSQPFGIVSKWSAKIDSVLGIQADYRIDDALKANLQVISRYHADDNFSPEVAWAYLGWSPNPTTSIRAGRLGTEFFMLADSRLVGFANLTVRPPPDYYGPLVLSYIDGIDASKDFPIGAGLLRGKLFAGLSPERMYLSDGLDWDMSGSRVIGGHLDYVTGPWQIRVGHTRVRFDKDPPIDAFAFMKYHLPNLTSQVPEMTVAGKWTRYDSLGVVYDDGPLQVQAMASRIDQGSAAFEDSRAGYLIASYRIGRVTPYVGYSRVKSEAARIADPALPIYGLVARGMSAATHADQHTWFLGARWDVRANLAIKAQVDRIDGRPESVFPYREEGADWDGDMTVFSLALDFVF